MDESVHGIPAREPGRSIGPVDGRLRALTFLAPGIPTEFFEVVVDHVARSLSCDISLEVESRSSGPMHGDSDPFAEGRADLGFLCSPSFLYLRARARPSIELVPAAFVFRDRRHQGEPVYYSDVVVRADHPAREFADLAGAVWGYNDECSLSGYFAALQKLSELRCASDFFRKKVRTGSHLASIEATLAGEIDGASIDSTVLASLLRERPELLERLRVLESWGPFPIQPMVVRAALGAGWPERIAASLFDLQSAEGHSRRLSGFGLERCVPIDDSYYDEERRALRALGQIRPDPDPSES